MRAADPLPVLRLRLAVFDMYQRIKPRYYEQAPVRVIDIDNESLRRLGQWPWPRTRIATLVERLSEFGAAAVAFAIVFAEPDRTSPFRAMKDWPQTSEVKRLSETLSLLPDHDRILANLFSSNPVVLGFAPDHIGESPPPPVKFGFAYIGGNPMPALDFYKSSITNLAPLQKSASGIGSLVISLDPDGLVRRIPLLARVGHKVYPALSVEALRVAQRATTIVARSSTIGSASSDAEAIPLELKIGRFTVPTGPRGDMWLHFTPPVPTRIVPAWRIFEANYAALASEFESRIVIIGASAAGLQNSNATPLNAAETSATIHAQALEQMLLQRFLQRPDWSDGAETILSLVLGGLLLFLLAFLVGPIAGAIVGSTVAILVWTISWVAYSRTGFLLDPLYPSLSVALTYLLVISLRYLASERDRRRVRIAFSRYLAPAVVEKLAQHPEGLKLGGETRNLTLMFCDIRGFTSIAEAMTAEELTAFINRFLTPMTKVVLESGGTIDKYMGDAIMAFWNAPIREPEHFLMGCRAALGISSRLEELNPVWESEAERAGKIFLPVQIGIGLNTGLCCVGNLGSEQRFDYSALGDAVNVASRLEQQTRIYGVDIIVGEDTQRLTTQLSYLELDRVQVRGRKEALSIYYLAGDERNAVNPAFVALQTRHDAALTAYRRQEWDKAAEGFEECRKLSGGKLEDLYSTYIVRLELLRTHPPGKDWDGVFRSPSK
ncbi:MAG: adenylate/guanylate cyclase domain-containing protein [Rhodospirillaceae bacterium]|nr:adenylate/guanylate cyclase domain-containing protein [Rhodospirillaceae bacterium]